MNNYRYYLTFDVGIKNLAYCLARYDKTKTLVDGLDIIDWNILDVSYKPLICKHIINKRKICNTNSVFYLLNEGIENKRCNHMNINNMIGYCQFHANELKVKDKKKHETLFRISKNSIFVNNVNTQEERLLRELENFYNQKLLSLYHNVNSEQESLNGQEYLISNLEIYIENQPVFMNPIMKTIMNTMKTFFTLKRVTSIKKIKSVNIISPKDKTHPSFITSLNNTFKITTKPNVNFKVYLERKYFTIDATDKIIETLNKSIFNIISNTNYQLSTKKDDMADTLMYIIYVALNK